MEWLFAVIAWLVLCGAAAAYASNKGRSGVGIFFLSLFLSPLVGFVVAVVMEPHKQKVAEAKGMKKCPDCAEFVQADAKICRFCRHEFAQPEALAKTLAPSVCPKCNSSEVFERSQPGEWFCRGCNHIWNIAG